MQEVWGSNPHSSTSSERFFERSIDAHPASTAAKYSNAGTRRLYGASGQPVRSAKSECTPPTSQPRPSDRSTALDPGRLVPHGTLTGDQSYGTRNMERCCHDDLVAYEHDEQARAEASHHRIHDDQIPVLRELCSRRVVDLGQGGVRAHCVPFSLTAWREFAECLPEAVRAQEQICRGDVFDLASQVLREVRRAVDLLTASFVWGMGKTGYGPHRYREICAAASGDLEQVLRRVLNEISDGQGCAGPVARYAQFYGGDNYEHRAAPGDERWSRLPGFGPAFFTKFLYFSTPGALILDARIARSVENISGLPHLVNSDGTVPAWTPYRYCVYLHWMNQTAQTVGIASDLLEVTLFEPPVDPPEEGEATE